ncbi:MAG: glycosyltransferase family 2 protein [Snowella sp.]|nr:glycosyltransferase family 2 protein [Snowella sp.]
MSGSFSFWLGLVCFFLLVTQVPATFILLSRLIKGAFRHPPLLPANCTPDLVGKVSVVVPTLNEVERIDPCLEGLHRQTEEVREILIVDSNSQDGTRERVQQMTQKDSRFQLLTDNPLPNGWVGRPWALNYGFWRTSTESEWFLGIDADTQPQPGLVASLVKAAESEGYDLLSLSPQFILQSVGEWWLQPALLMTLLYRFDSAGVRDQAPERVMANGQCFLCRRSVLEKLDGYKIAAGSFCDDVTLARYVAQQGYRVGFFDGAKVIRVRMYEGMAETWKEWGRSLDLKDASSVAQLWGDVILLTLVQGLPLVLIILLELCSNLSYGFLTLKIAIFLNLLLVTIRFALLIAVYPSYYRAKKSLATLSFWFSPFADPVAVVRIILSALQKPKQWRGRVY